MKSTLLIAALLASACTVGDVTGVQPTEDYNHGDAIEEIYGYACEQRAYRCGHFAPELIEECREFNTERTCNREGGPATCEVDWNWEQFEGDLIECMGALNSWPCEGLAYADLPSVCYRVVYRVRG